MKTLFSYIEGAAVIKLKQPISVTWAQCHPACPGWLHMHDEDASVYVERCDECQRFPADDAARAAHADECSACDPD